MKEDTIRILDELSTARGMVFHNLKMIVDRLDKILKTIQDEKPKQINEPQPQS